jgi:hypothetical protein
MNLEEVQKHMTARDRISLVMDPDKKDLIYMALADDVPDLVAEVAKLNLQLGEARKALEYIRDREYPERLGWGTANRFLEKWPSEKPECDCLVPAMEGAGQHSPSCAIFKVAQNRVEVATISHCYSTYCHYLTGRKCMCLCAACAAAVKADH